MGKSLSPLGKMVTANRIATGDRGVVIALPSATDVARPQLRTVE